MLVLSPSGADSVKNPLEIVFREVTVKESFEKDAVKEMILTKSHRELGMNKSTLWYQKKRLEETGSVRLYNKIRRHFE